MYLFLFLTLTCLSTGAYAVVHYPCTVDDQCDVGECCQILSWIMVASKKRATDDYYPERAGSCQKYSREGSHCLTYDKTNGYCSCEPGTYCKLHEVPIRTGRRSERGLPMSRPGYEWISTCDKITVTGGKRTVD